MVTWHRYIYGLSLVKICQKLWPVSKNLRTDKQTDKPSDEHTCQNWKFWQVTNKPSNEHTCQNCKFWQVIKHAVDYYWLMAKVEPDQTQYNCMMTSSNGNIFRVTGPLCGEFTGPGEFPAQRPVTRRFDVFFDLRPNKRLSKQLWGWWFETPSWSLWHQCNVRHPLFIN